MAPPAARWPDALRLSNRKAASSRLFSPEFLLPLPFFFSCVARTPSPAKNMRSLAPPDSRGRLSPHGLFMFFPESLNLHIHAGGKIELHQRIHGLRRRIENVEQTFVRADLKLFARLLVHVRRTQHRVLVLHRRQWNRAGDLCACALGGSDDFRRGLIEHAVIVCLQPDANFFVSYHVSFPDPSRHLRKARACGKLQAAIYLLNNLRNRSLAHRVSTWTTS